MTKYCPVCGDFTPHKSENECMSCTPAPKAKRKLRLKFWMWVHDRAEDFWHWVWINKVQPLMPPIGYEENLWSRGTYTIVPSDKPCLATITIDPNAVTINPWFSSVKEIPIEEAKNVFAQAPGTFDPETGCAGVGYDFSHITPYDMAEMGLESRVGLEQTIRSYREYTALENDSTPETDTVDDHTPKD